HHGFPTDQYLVVLPDLYLHLRHHLSHGTHTESLGGKATHGGSGFGEAVPVDEMHVDRLHELVDGIRQGRSRYREEITPIDSHYPLHEIEEGLPVQEKLHLVSQGGSFP